MPDRPSRERRRYVVLLDGVPTRPLRGCNAYQLSRKPKWKGRAQLVRIDGGDDGSDDGGVAP